MHDGELEYIEHIKEAPMRLLIVSMESSGPHWHEEYEAVFVLRGSVFFSGETAVRELGAGDVLIVNPREVHSYRGSAENICLILQFSPNIISEVYGRVFVFDSGRAGELRRTLAEMGLAFQNKPDGYQFAVKSGLYALVSLMFRHLKYEPLVLSKIGGEYLADFDAIKKYIKEHFKDDIDQEQIGRALGMSRAKIYRVLKSAGDVSTKDMTNFYRVEHAKYLLKSTEKSLPFIAEDSGFESDSSFYRVFRKLAGVTPQDYRVSPAKAARMTVIQGYAAHSPHESQELLRKWAAS